MRQLVLEFGGHGERVNGVSADWIRLGMLNDGLIRERGNARGVDEEGCLAANPLNQEVEAEHVAESYCYPLARRLRGI